MMWCFYFSPSQSSLFSLSFFAPSIDNQSTGRWTSEEHLLFLKGLELHGKGWKLIATLIQTRTVVQIRWAHAWPDTFDYKCKHQMPLHIILLIECAASHYGSHPRQYLFSHVFSSIFPSLLHLFSSVFFFFCCVFWGPAARRRDGWVRFVICT